MALADANMPRPSTAIDAAQDDDLHRQALSEAALEDMEAGEAGAAEVCLLQGARFLRRSVASAGAAQTEESRAIAGLASKRGCPTDFIVGKWEAANALGTNMTATLAVLPSNGDCQGITANFDIVGATGVYAITTIENLTAASDALLKKDATTVKVRFENIHGKYFHEGVYDASADVLLEDLAYVNGSFVGGGILEFHRV